MTTPHNDPLSLDGPADRDSVRALTTLLAGVTFARADQAVHTDGPVQLRITPRMDPHHGDELLCTLYAGFPPPPAVAGLPWVVTTGESEEIVRVGQTDRRGQFRLRGLEPRAYRLRLEGGCPFPLVESHPNGNAGDLSWSATAAQISPAFEHARAHGARHRQQFHSPDGSVRSCVLVTTRSGQLALEAEVRLDALLWGGQSLARVRVWTSENLPIMQCYLGLFEIGDGHSFGRVLLDQFVPNLRNLATDGCFFRLDPQPLARLAQSDRPVLSASAAATDDPRSQAVIEAAKGSLRELPAAAGDDPSSGRPQQ